MKNVNIVANRVEAQNQLSKFINKVTPELFKCLDDGYKLIKNQSELDSKTKTKITFIIKYALGLKAFKGSRIQCYVEIGSCGGAVIIIFKTNYHITDSVVVYINDYSVYGRTFEPCKLITEKQYLKARETLKKINGKINELNSRASNLKHFLGV